MADFDVIVLGVGSMGSATVYHLARRGMRTLGLEQFDIPHSRGSSHGQSRMIRQAYFEHPDYVPLLKRAYELWGDLEHESGQRLFARTGGVYIGRADGTLVGGSRRSAEVHGLAHEMLSRDALRERYPQFRVPEEYVGLYEPAAGYLLPERVVGAHARLAMERGAELRGHERVMSWEANGDGVRVVTHSGEYRAKQLVITVGTWANQVMGELGVKIRATRQVLGWVWPRKPEMFGLGRMPVWAVENADGTEHYGFPMDAGLATPGFKLAHHTPGEMTDPDRNEWGVNAGDEATFRGVLERVLPDANGRLLGIRVCMYENSPDSHFVIDRHPGKPNVTVACGFSGHGFKFSSVVGEVLADLAMAGQTRHPIGFLSLGRFRRGASAPA